MKGGGWKGRGGRALPPRDGKAGPGGPGRAGPGKGQADRGGNDRRTGAHENRPKSREGHSQPGRGGEPEGGRDSRPQPGWGEKPHGSWKPDGKPKPFGWKDGPKPAFHKGGTGGGRGSVGTSGGKGPGGRSAYGPKGRPAGPAPSKQELGRLMALYGVKLPQPTLDQLWKYHQFLRANNKDLDLTRLIGFETMAQRHYADCMILHGFMQGRWPSPLVDVGSGAGFPGIMIKLMSPKTRIVLAEPRPRRVDFLERTIKELGLKDISVFPHKVTSRSFTEPMAGTITRAFETVEKSLPRFGGCLGVGGLAIFMKGPKVAEELTELRNDEYRVVKNHVYRIPNTTLDRALLVMERIKVPDQPPAGPGLEEDDEIPEGEDLGGDG